MERDGDVLLEAKRPFELRVIARVGLSTNGKKVAVGIDVQQAELFVVD